MQTADYEGYAKVCAEQGLVAVGCWAHAGRKFDEALKAQQLLSHEKQKKSLAAVTLAKIQALCRIERDIRSLPPKGRQRIRILRSMPLLEEFRTWLDAHIPIVPPRSALGKALNYAHKQWPKLVVYLDDGRLRMDNNLVENAIRPFVISRKSYLFCDTVNGANASANLYSLVETSRANGIEPYAYPEPCSLSYPMQPRSKPSKLCCRCRRATSASRRYHDAKCGQGKPAVNATVTHKRHLFSVDGRLGSKLASEELQ